MKWQKNTGVQPVADDVRVEVKFRGGSKDIDTAGVYLWRDICADCYITHWRLAIPLKQYEYDSQLFKSLEKALGQEEAVNVMLKVRKNTLAEDSKVFYKTVLKKFAAPSYYFSWEGSPEGFEYWQAIEGQIRETYAH